MRSGPDRRRRRGNALPTRVVTEFAWHSLFIRNLLIRPEAGA
jgi:phosphoenolpyruvate carboxykinase (ATP)